MVATSFYPPEQRGRAVAIVFGGLTVALALGVPAGSMLGGPLGFRGVFALVAAAGLLAAIGVRLLVPSVPAPPHVTLEGAVLRAAQPHRADVLLVTVLGVLGVMSVYIYLVPLLAAYTGVTGPRGGALLTVYGVGALDRQQPRRPRRRPLRARPHPSWSLFVAIVLALVDAAADPHHVARSRASPCSRGASSTWAFNPPFQSLILDVAGEQGRARPLAQRLRDLPRCRPLRVVGGLVVSGPGVQFLPLVGAGLGLVAAAVFAASSRAGSGARDRAPEPAPVG